MINQGIIFLWSSMQFYLSGEQGGVVSGDRLNQHHHCQCLPSRVPVFYNYGLVSSHLSWTGLFWRLTQDKIQGGRR